MLWLHHFNRLLAAASLILIAAGGLVTSTGSGLAVPDWPNTYGYFMFAFPLKKMIGGVLYEHGHRLIASTVGLMTVALAFGLSRVEPRRWVRLLGWAALAVVITQGILGGITVLYFLPAPVSIGHAGLAQLFFVLIVGLAIFTSPGWLRRYDRDTAMTRDIVSDITLRRLVILTAGIVYAQTLVGAIMRHTGAGLAIPDFPLTFSRVIPLTWDTGIGVHFAHRVGAVVVVTLVVALSAQILTRRRIHTELVRPAVLLLAVVAAQFALGAWTVLSERHVAVNTAHVTTGALLFGTSVVLALRVHRDRFSDAVPDRNLSAQVERIRSARLRSHGSPGASI